MSRGHQKVWTDADMYTCIFLKHLTESKFLPFPSLSLHDRLERDAYKWERKLLGFSPKSAIYWIRPLDASLSKILSPKFLAHRTEELVCSCSMVHHDMCGKGLCGSPLGEPPTNDPTSLNICFLRWLWNWNTMRMSCSHSYMQIHMWLWGDPCPLPCAEERVTMSRNTIYRGQESSAQMSGSLCYGLNLPPKLMLKWSCHCHSIKRWALKRWLGSSWGLHLHQWVNAIILGVGQLLRVSLF